MTRKVMRRRMYPGDIATRGQLYNPNDVIKGYTNEWEQDYRTSLEEHLVYYREAALRLGVSYSLSDIHDHSKYSKEEYFWYVRKFGGDQKDDEFGAAWLHHIHFNPHHWERWIIPKRCGNRVIEMLGMYVVEMVADWMGSSKAYTGTFDMSNWLNDNLRRVQLHFESAKLLVNLLNDLEYPAEILSKLDMTHGMDGR